MEQQSKKKLIGNYLADRWRGVGASVLASAIAVYVYYRTKEVVDPLIENWEQTLLLGGTAALTGVGVGKVFDHILDKDKRPRKMLFRTGALATAIGLVATFPVLTDQKDTSSPKSTDKGVEVGNNAVMDINGQQVLVFALPETPVSCQPIAPRPVIANDSPWTIIRGALGLNEVAASGDSTIPEQATKQLHDLYPDLFDAELFVGQLVSVTCL